MMRIRSKRATGENMAQPQQGRPISLTLRPSRPLREVRRTGSIPLCDRRCTSRVRHGVFVLLVRPRARSGASKRISKIGSKTVSFGPVSRARKLTATYGRFCTRPLGSQHAAAIRPSSSQFESVRLHSYSKKIPPGAEPVSTTAGRPTPGHPRNRRPSSLHRPLSRVHISPLP
jgi:hypothetical protein